MPLPWNEYAPKATFMDDVHTLKSMVCLERAGEWRERESAYDSKRANVNSYEPLPESFGICPPRVLTLTLSSHSLLHQSGLAK